MKNLPITISVFLFFVSTVSPNIAYSETRATKDSKETELIEISKINAPKSGWLSELNENLGQFSIFLSVFYPNALNEGEAQDPRILTADQTKALPESTAKTTAQQKEINVTRAK